MLLRNGRLKHVVRAAMAGLLPEGVRLRVTPTPLRPLVQRGLAEKEQQRLESLLRDRESLWGTYVQRERLQQILESDLPTGLDGAAALVPWHCAAFLLWQYNIAGAGVATTGATTRGGTVIKDKTPQGSTGGEDALWAPARTYSAPEVEHVEHLHRAILAGSPGNTDSANGNTEQTPGGAPMIVPPGSSPGDGTTASPWEPPPQAPPTGPVEPWGETES
jgi:hypothetical protein